MSAKQILLAQYDLHNLLFNNALEGITDEEAGKSVAAPMNSIKWIAGHLLITQMHFARLGNVNVDIPWQDHFPAGPGAPKTDGPKSEMPTLDEIKGKWNEINPQIRAGLEGLPEEALSTPIEARHPLFPFNNTLGGLWAFINHHSAYTIGQLGILRRGHNKDAMKYS
jgi:hypothetical protein